MRYLLDANVLAAIGLPEHVHHATARAWFRDHRGQGWATCPATQAAFVRVSNGASAGAVRRPAVAIEFLRQLTSDPRHEFWPLASPMTFLDSDLRTHLRGAHQVAAFQLLDLAMKRGGKLVTFDAKFAGSLAKDPRLSGAIELIPTLAGVAGPG